MNVNPLGDLNFSRKYFGKVGVDFYQYLVQKLISHNHTGGEHFREISVYQTPCVSLGETFFGACYKMSQVNNALFSSRENKTFNNNSKSLIITS